MTESAAPEGVMARVLREALRTPAYREILRLNVGGMGRNEAADLVRVALREDPELWLRLASAAPALADSLVQSLTALGRELAAMPDLLVDSYLAQLAADVDGEALRELPVVWAPLLSRALPGALNRALDAARMGRTMNRAADLVLAAEREAPEWLADLRSPDWAALLRELDAGRLREAVIALSAGGRRGAQELLTTALADPVLVANLVGMLPPLANDGLALLSRAVQELDLPDEVLASAIFNVLRALDLPEVGRLLSGVAETVGTLHRGSATLGRDEPAFQAVLAELVDGLLDTLDLDAVARAAVALGEDGEVAARVLARRVATDPRLLDHAVDTAARLLDIAARAGLQVAWEMEQLPTGTAEVIADRLGAVDGHALGQLFNRTLDMMERAADAGGGAPALAAFSEEVDAERARRLLLRAGAPTIRRFAGDLWQRVRSEPELIARELNALAARFNRYLEEDPGDAEGALSRVVGALDKAELGRAWRGGMRLLGRTLVAAAPSSPRLGALLHRGAGLVARARSRGKGGDS